MSASTDIGVLNSYNYRTRREYLTKLRVNKRDLSRSRDQFPSGTHSPPQPPACNGAATIGFRRGNIIRREQRECSAARAGRGAMPSACLPSWELSFYLAITVGFHFYSFHEVYQLSRNYEEELDAEFGFEKGFFIWGFKKDPTDFEWSFWTEWTKNLLVWTLLGHIIVSQVTIAFFPKFRMWLLMMYGMLACFLTMGFKGLLVILLHVFISYVVAQLQVPVLSWLCSILLLYSLQMDSLGKIEKSWYETENEYFLLLFCLALCNLRYTSFSLEYCWYYDGPRRLGVSFCWLLAYIFYYPIFHNGPIICYDDFINQMRKPKVSVPKKDLACLLLSGVRILFWWCLTESMLQLMYIHAIQQQETILESASYWTLGGLGFAHTLFFYMKYLLFYGIPSIIMHLDGIEPPRLPRCTSSLYSFTGTWREFDVGLHRWLVRYIYIPLGGSRHGILRIMFSSAVAFSFVCYWHGGHSFMLNWAALNWAGVMLESILKMICSISPVQEIIEQSLSVRMQRRAHAALASVATTLLILSNLVFLCGNRVGYIYWNRMILQDM
ncbi:protein-cysteine N-palmitoyltransferase HHAT isoform X3 [Chiloscyllium plagiosum]|uniref:protein-cysteine N-palmitoyltransferase HHAT isoform X3 n=1 Tax=Chiloscyllium plagiosum TaxID=36176 RepID=UPI001CB856DF|nr:protein-cysteine N-palmitoyltransferase HHAT isoform X3 [Chiloscyllium plagiosum]